MNRGDKFFNMLFGAAITILVIVAQTALAVPDNTGNQESLQLIRACIPEVGAPVRLQAQTGADAESGALDENENMRIDCDTDAWCDFAASAAASEATANDTKMRAGIPEYFGTGTTATHVSCLSVTTNGDCRITKCR